jgi:hypothetical protein
MTPPHDAPLRRTRIALATAVVAALVAIALAIVASTLFIAIRTHHPLPTQEEWMNVIVFKSWLAGADPLGDLFSQHSEHRIVVPRLIMFADYLWFGGGGYFSLAAIILGLFVLLAVFLWLLYRLGPRDKGAIGVAALIPILLFSLAQWENFRSGIQVYFVGVVAAATCAIVLFGLGLQRARDDRPSAHFVVASFLLLGVATFSMASGLLAGVVMVVAALLARAPQRYAVGAGAMTLVYAAVYFFHFHFPDASELYSAFGLPPQDPAQPKGFMGVILFTLAYLGNFLDPWRAGAIALGAIGAALVASDFLRFLLARDTNLKRLTLHGVALFVGGSALLTAVGRLPHEGLDAAMSSRYTLASACFWCAVLIGLWSRSRQPHFRPIRLATLGALGATLLGAALVAQPPGAAILREQALLQDTIANALLLDFFDQNAIEISYTKPDWVRSMTPLLKERRMSIFATPDARLFGAPLADAGPVDAGACPGSFDAASVDETLGQGGVRVAGASSIDSAILTTLRIYLVDDGKKIIGFASRAADDAAWTGYAAAAAQTTLAAYARQTSGRLCLIGTQTISSADASHAE